MECDPSHIQMIGKADRQDVTSPDWGRRGRDVRVMGEARLVRRHHKHSSNDPANFPTNSQTDKFLHLPPSGSSSAASACDIKTPFYSVFFEDSEYFFVTSIQGNVNIAHWGPGPPIFTPRVGAC